MKPYAWQGIVRPLVEGNRMDVDYPLLRQQLGDGEKMIYRFIVGTIPFAFFIEDQNDFAELERRHSIKDITRIGIYAVEL